MTKGLQKLRAWAAADPSRSRSWIGRMIGRSQPTVSAWFSEANGPDAASRTRLKVLTGIPVEDWDAEEDREFLEELKKASPKKSARPSPRAPNTAKKQATPLRAASPKPTARKTRKAA